MMKREVRAKVSVDLQAKSPQQRGRIRRALLAARRKGSQRSHAIQIEETNLEIRASALGGSDDTITKLAMGGYSGSTQRARGRLGGQCRESEGNAGNELLKIGQTCGNDGMDNVEGRNKIEVVVTGDDNEACDLQSVEVEESSVQV